MTEDLSVEMDPSEFSLSDGPYSEGSNQPLGLALSSGLVPVSPSQTSYGLDRNHGRSSIQKIHLHSFRLSSRQTMISRMCIWNPKSSVALSLGMTTST